MSPGYREPLMLRQAAQLFQGHMARKWQGWKLNPTPNPPTPCEPHLLSTMRGAGDGVGVGVDNQKHGRIGVYNLRKSVYHKCLREAIGCPRVLRYKGRD